MSIGSRIKEARKTLNLTQEDLATIIGVTKGAIANYENEVSIPKIELLLKLMEALQVDANYLYQDDVRVRRIPTVDDDSPSALDDDDKECFNIPTLGSKIRVKRQELGISQSELASALGYSDRSTIAKIEKGVNDITQSKIESFAAALHTTPAYLMGWEEKKEPAPENEDRLDEEVVELIRSLPPEKMKQLKTFLRFLKSDANQSDESH